MKSRWMFGLGLWVFGMVACGEDGGSGRRRNDAALFDAGVQDGGRQQDAAAASCEFDESILTPVEPAWTVAQLEACNAACAEFDPNDPSMLQDLAGCYAMCEGYTEFSACLTLNNETCHANGGPCEQPLRELYCCQVESGCELEHATFAGVIECVEERCGEESQAWGQCSNSVGGSVCFDQAFDDCVDTRAETSDAGAPSDGGVQDATAMDSGAANDGGMQDAGAQDAGVQDAAEPDAGADAA